MNTRTEAEGHTTFQLEDTLKLSALIRNYHELNANKADELCEAPTPLEFMRYVHLNRPFIVRGGARHWDAVRHWSAPYLKSKLGKTPVNVACTPLGNADAVVASEDDSLSFVKPFETLEPFDEALSRIQQQGMSDSASSDIVRYLQTQNDNLRGEYSDLFDDVPTDISFARIALRTAPDAINFWLGNSRSTTALHKDNYENVYVQVLGQKHFILLPPVEAACVNERELPAATYVRGPSKAGDLEVQLDKPETTVPFATWDPDEPEERSTSFSGLSQPLRLTLDPGDMLYLPARWYHKVKQSCGEEGICVAVNYWYDMEYSGVFHSMTTFVRDVSRTNCGDPCAARLG